MHTRWTFICRYLQYAWRGEHIGTIRSRRVWLLLALRACYGKFNAVSIQASVYRAGHPIRID